MTLGPLPFSERTPMPAAMPAGPAVDELRAYFFELCQVHGLEITFRSEATESWQSVLEQAAYVPVAYTQPMLDYQSAYFTSHELTSVEASIVIMNDRRPCSGWPLLWN